MESWRGYLVSNMEDLSKGEIIIYESDGKSRLEVIQQDNTLWLSAEKIGKLFGKDRSNIQRHIAKIYREQELDENSTCAFFAQVQKEGKRTVSRNISYSLYASMLLIKNVVLSVLNRGGEG